MEAYQQSGQVKFDDADWIAFAENVGKSREKEGHRPDLRLRWAGVAMLLLLLVGLGWFVWRYVSDRVAASNSGHSISEPADAAALVPAAASSKR
jgi:cytoskeleton protein RodZ